MERRDKKQRKVAIIEKEKSLIIKEEKKRRNEIVRSQVKGITKREKKEINTGENEDDLIENEVKRGASEGG